MDLVDRYLDLACQREKELAREASEAGDQRRTRKCRSAHGEKGSLQPGKSLCRTALYLTKLMGKFPY
jgi:hypothetical protein